MHTTTKGALAAGAAAVLLLGGAGSLAYWNDSDTIGAGTITAGNLDVDTSLCTNAGWTVSNATEKVTNQPFNLTNDRVVPGDVLTKTCNVKIVAVGKDIRAVLSVTNGATTGTDMSTADYSVGQTFTLGSQSADNLTVTHSDVDRTVVATITVTFPLREGGAAQNDSKLKKVVLGNYAVTATQATTPAA